MARDGMVRKLSGLQKEAIHLYRDCIRTAYNKPEANRAHFTKYFHDEFSKYRDLPRKDFTTIEHLLRVGAKKLEVYSHPEVKDIH